MNRRYRRKRAVDEAERARKKTKSSVRVKVEPKFLVIKRLFGFAKTRYRGLQWCAHWLLVACALAHLHMNRRRLLRLA